MVALDPERLVAPGGIDLGDGVGPAAGVAGRRGHDLGDLGDDRLIKRHGRRRRGNRGRRLGGGRHGRRSGFRCGCGRLDGGRGCGRGGGGRGRRWGDRRSGRRGGPGCRCARIGGRQSLALDGARRRGVRGLGAQRVETGLGEGRHGDEADHGGGEKKPGQRGDHHVHHVHSC
ncbi:hypothetical protein CXZ10_10290 [Pleomorphomonas diazotrophica]|uniref:Uncharacterized protein n=1 Tax=Pleomorphomonas diazotrophica TaxID=1166257 RepID=A0A2N3LXD7_9HYPH|nr:hypothetical protein CXZ10_10290 [Pleomorphomonas diazotrophica]